MPSNPRSRRRSRTRRPPPRPNVPGAPAADAGTAQALTRQQEVRSSRPSRLIERQTPYVVAELKRVLGVSIATFGLLIVLVVIDRLQ